MIVGTLGLAVAFHLPVRLWQSLAALFSLNFEGLTDRATPFDGLTAPFGLFPLLCLVLWLGGADGLIWTSAKPAVERPVGQRRVGWQAGGVGLGLAGAVAAGGLERFSLLLPDAAGRLPASDYDEMVYFSGASLIAQGHLPYRDFFLAHPPLADFFYAGLLRLSGLRTGNLNGFLLNRWGEIGLGLASVIAIFWVGSQIWRRRGGGAAWLPGLAAAWLYALDARASDVATLETPANFLGLVGLGCCLEGERRSAGGWKEGRWWLVGGVLIALSTLCKVPGAALLLAVGLYPLLERRWAILGWLTGGVGAGVGVVMGGLSLAGVGPGEELRQIVFFQFLRPAEGRGKEQIGRMADDPQSLLTFAVATLALIVLTGGLGVGRGLGRETRRWLLPILWSLPLVAIFSLGKSFHPWYYVQWAAPLALLGGGLFAPALWQNFAPLWKGWPNRVRRSLFGLVGVGVLVALPLGWSQWEASRRVEYDRVYRPTASVLQTRAAGLVFDPGYSFMAGLSPVRLPGDNKFLVDSAGYMTYLNLDMDRRGWGQLLGGTSGRTPSEVFAGERGQALVVEGLSRAGWVVLDQKLALPQLTPRSAEFIGTGATRERSIAYADLYRVRPWEGRRPRPFANGLVATPMGLSSSKGATANFDPVGPGEILRLKPGETGGRSLDLRLVWRVERTPSQADKVFVHLVNEAGTTLAQRDVLPLNDRADTRQWRPGDAFEDVHSLPLPANLPPGRYRVEMGLYEAESGQRISVEGQGSLTIGFVEVVSGN